MSRRKSATWADLLRACRREGEAVVLARLETWHRGLQWAEATAWEDPATHADARQLAVIIARQAETLARLHFMTEEQIEAALEEWATAAPDPATPATADAPPPEPR